MTAEALLFGHRSGLITPTRWTTQSEPAASLRRMCEQIRMELLNSYVVRSAAEHSLSELEEVRAEASAQGWDGYGGRPMHPDAYLKARLFLEAMPTTAPRPEISADPDGDVALDWIFGQRKALSVSINPTGRCTFAWMLGQSTSRGTVWFDDGIPAQILSALSNLAR